MIIVQSSNDIFTINLNDLSDNNNNYLLSVNYQLIEIMD